MARRYPNHRLVKRHRNYTVEEIACLLGVHENTVRRWVKHGLPLVDDGRPFLILGRDLVQFLQKQRERHRQPCATGEMYCFRCRTSKVAAGGMLEYEPVNHKVVNAVGICPDCGCLMHRLLRIAELGIDPWKLDTTFPQALRHISEMNQRSVNSDLRGDV